YMCTNRNRDINERYEVSGLSQWAFADQEGISVATLNYHLNRARARAVAGFTHLEVVPLPDKILITTKGGTTIEIPI
ncbi:MAG: hypothetical protein OIF38_03115, partial [Cellvibrionaceae bacterium]|nr:hypothetical protein [Cellvibrionaceae bacterium]